MTTYTLQAPSFDTVAEFFRNLSLHCIGAAPVKQQKQQFRTRLVKLRNDDAYDVEFEGNLAANTIRRIIRGMPDGSQILPTLTAAKL